MSMTKLDLSHGVAPRVGQSVDRGEHCPLLRGGRCWRELTPPGAGIEPHDPAKHARECLIFGN